ncbi:MAG: MFS transporter [Akkermansia sp.]|nr:MFS transporter [Akkermansia sp.]
MSEPNPILSFLADLTPWVALGIAVLAVLSVMKKGLSKSAISPNAPVTKPGKWAWIAVAILWVVVMLNYFDRQLLGVLNKSMTEGPGCIEMTQAQFGMVTSAFLIVYAALSPVGGYLADRFSRSFIIMCSLVVWSVVTWMTGKSETYEELLFWRAMMGVSEAFYIPAALALITDYHRGGTRSLATGLHMSGIYAGQALAGCGALMAGDPCQLGWRLTFEVFGFIGVAYGLIVLFFLRDPKAEQSPVAAAVESVKETVAEAVPGFTMGQMLKGVFSGRGMYLLLLMIAFAGYTNWFLLNWYPRLLQDFLANLHSLGLNLDITDEDAAVHSTSWLSLTKYISVLGCAVLADLWYMRNKNARAYVPGIAFLVAGPCVLIAACFDVQLGFYAVVALVAMQGIAQGAMDATLMPVLRNTIDERFSATGYGFLNLTSVGAGALVAWLGGWMKDEGIALTTLLAMGGVAMVLCGIILFCLPKKENA